MKKMFGTLFVLAALGSTPLSAQVIDVPTVNLDQFAPADVSTIRMLLSGYHDLAPQAAFEEVPNASAIVAEFANGAHSVVRDRALAALGQYWPSADVYLMYARVIADDATASGTRHRVVLMYAEAFGDRAMPAIQPLLQSDDLQMQITVVQALGIIGTDEARALVFEFAKTVENPVLLAQIDKSTQRIR